LIVIFGVTKESRFVVSRCALHNSLRQSGGGVLCRVLMPGLKSRPILRAPAYLKRTGLSQAHPLLSRVPVMRELASRCGGAVR
jgi:hypothetical protein